MTHRGVPVHDRDRARSGGDIFRAHDREGIVEGHDLAAQYAPGRVHVTVAVRTLTFDEAVLPQLKEGHVNLVAMNQSACRRCDSPRGLVVHAQVEEFPDGPLATTTDVVVTSIRRLLGCVVAGRSHKQAVSGPEQEVLPHERPEHRGAHRGGHAK